MDLDANSNYVYLCSYCNNYVNLHTFKLTDVSIFEFKCAN